MSEQDREIVTIPYFVHEGETSRLERIIRRLWVLLILLVVLLVGSNVAWVIYENSFEDIVITQDGWADGSGQNYFNGTGEMNYGGTWTSDSEDPGEPR